LILPDVNVLIYAFRTDSEDHQRYKDWLESVVNGPAAYGIAPQVLASVVRITTHTRVYRRPSSRADVFGFCRLLLMQPNAPLPYPASDTGQYSRTSCQGEGDGKPSAGRMVRGTGHRVRL